MKCISSYFSPQLEKYAFFPRNAMNDVASNHNELDFRFKIAFLLCFIHHIPPPNQENEIYNPG